MNAEDDGSTLQTVFDLRFVVRIEIPNGNVHGNVSHMSLARQIGVEVASSPSGLPFAGEIAAERLSSGMK